MRSIRGWPVISGQWRVKTRLLQLRSRCRLCCEVAGTPATDYMASPDDFRIWLQKWRISEWLVRFSCRWRSWRTGHGCMRGGCRWDADGMGIALCRGMRVRLRRRRSCGSFATLAMRRVVAGCHGSGRGIRCGLRPGPCAVKGRTGLVASIQVRYVCERGHRPAEHGTLEFDTAAERWGGNSGIATAECSAWRNAFWNRMSGRLGSLPTGNTRFPVPASLRPPSGSILFGDFQNGCLEQRGPWRPPQ